MAKNRPAKQEIQECGFDPWVRKIPWKRSWRPIPVFLPGKSHGLRSLVGYSPWGCKELDTTEVTGHASMQRSKLICYICINNCFKTFFENACFQKYIFPILIWKFTSIIFQVYLCAWVLFSFSLRLSPYVNFIPCNYYSDISWYPVGYVPHSLGSSSLFCYACDICLPETNRLPHISSAKMSLFGINRELQFSVYNHCEVCANPPCDKGKRTLFTEMKMKLGRLYKQRAHGFSLAESLLGKRRNLSSSCWAQLLSQSVRAPHSGLPNFLN